MRRFVVGLMVVATIVGLFLHAGFSAKKAEDDALVVEHQRQIRAFQRALRAANYHRAAGSTCRHTEMDLPSFPWVTFDLTDVSALQSDDQMAQYQATFRDSHGATRLTKIVLTRTRPFFVHDDTTNTMLATWCIDLGWTELANREATGGAGRGGEVRR